MIGLGEEVGQGVKLNWEEASCLKCRDEAARRGTNMKEQDEENNSLPRLKKWAPQSLAQDAARFGLSRLMFLLASIIIVFQGEFIYKCGRLFQPTSRKTSPKQPQEVFCAPTELQCAVCDLQRALQAGARKLSSGASS